MGAELIRHLPETAQQAVSAEGEREEGGEANVRSPHEAPSHPRRRVSRAARARRKPDPSRLRLACCPHCGSEDLEETGLEDLPEPKVELHRYRRHVQACRECQGRGSLELPGAHVGRRARLLAGYCRAHPGLSLEKTTDLLGQLFGLNLSRAGALDHLRWGATLFSPVVEAIFRILRALPVIHADETSWRLDGRNVGAWCFSNPQLALFLIGQRRSAEVVKRALGDGLVGVLVTDFYAAYHAIACKRQKCLVYLLRDLNTLREELSRHHVTNYVGPLIALLQDAIALSKRRETLSPKAYATACREIEDRLDALVFQRPRQPDCRRLNR